MKRVDSDGGGGGGGHADDVCWNAEGLFLIRGIGLD